MPYFEPPKGLSPKVLRCSLGRQSQVWMQRKPKHTHMLMRANAVVYQPLELPGPLVDEWCARSLKRRSSCSGERGSTQELEEVYSMKDITV